MKTNGLITVIAIAAILITGFSMQSTVKASEETPPTSPNVVNITLSQAIQVPGLVDAMYNQLDDSFLTGETFYYTQPVLYNGVVFMVTGTLPQWTNFFRMKPVFVALDLDIE